MLTGKSYEAKVYPELTEVSRGVCPYPNLTIVNC
jgi:hypothetical protein